MRRDRFGFPILVSLVVTAGVLSACDSSVSGVDRSHGIAVLASESHGPGTSLGDGLRVPEGAVLAGAALPEANVQLIFAGKPVRARSWTAFLGVGGSPSRVATELLRQAHRAGYPNLPTRPTCAPNGSGQIGPTGTSIPPGSRMTTAAPSSCGFETAFGPADQPPSGRRLMVGVGRDPALGTLGIVTFDDYGGSVATPPQQCVHLPLIRVEAPPAAPTGLPSTGQRIGKDPGFVVVPGSAAVLPTLPVDGHNWTALLSVSGKSGRVFDAYRAQLRRNLHASSGPVTSDNGTRRFTERSERRGAWRARAINGNDGNPDGVGESVELLTQGDQSYIRLHATYG